MRKHPRRRNARRPNRARRQPRTRATTGQPGSAGPAGKSAAARRAAARSNLPILTLDRFDQAMQIARLAAEHDLAELSLKAVHDALRAGPPVVPVNNSSATLVRTVRVGMEENAVRSVLPACRHRALAARPDLAETQGCPGGSL